MRFTYVVKRGAAVSDGYDLDTGILALANGGTSKGKIWQTKDALSSDVQKVRG